MSYYIIDLAFHALLAIACTICAVVSFCIEVWPLVIMQLIIAIGCIFLVVLDIKEIKTELWWNKQVKLKQSFIDEEDLEQ